MLRSRAQILPLMVRPAILALAVAAVASPAGADEGMWPFDRAPLDMIRSAHGFAPDQAWLDRVRAHSVRLENGCSGAVVSQQGLVATNHHCIAECLAELSSPRSNHIANGFIAEGRRGERVCPGLETSILTATVDVTERVEKAAASMAPADREGARRREASRIEAETCGDDPARRCQVVSLYRGAKRVLHRYDRYSDVRLVFAPELEASFFGGEIDNFSFPRYSFDVALLRLYRDGEPVRFADPLRFATAPPQDGELVFVSGHPGDTRRDMTVAQLERERDHDLPALIEYLAQLRGALLNESIKGEEETRQLFDMLQSVENSLKAYRGQRLALVEPAFFTSRVAAEADLRRKLTADPDLIARFGDPFAEIESLLLAERSLFAPWRMLEQAFGSGSVLLADARTLVRAAEERAKPDAERLAEYVDDRLGRMEGALLAQGPIHPALERLLIEYWLDQTREQLGPDHAAVKALFGARTSAQIAGQIVRASQVGDHGFRGRLWRDAALVAATDDPAIELVRQVDAAARAARADYTRRVSGPIAEASRRLAGLRFAIDGDDSYPEATFTLRLSYGVVKGWNDPALGQVDPFTRVSGLWSRATGAFPYRLPDRWVAARGRLSGDAVFNFTTTNDTVGGSSGSPLLDRHGRVVGVLFDGNLPSLGGAYGFDPAHNRSIGLSAPLIVEALRKVYQAEALADELSK